MTLNIFGHNCSQSLRDVFLEHIHQVRFKTGLAAGDFFHAVCAKTGKDVYYWTEHTHTITKGKSFNTKLERHNDKLNDSDLALAENTYSAFSAFTFKSLADDNVGLKRKGSLALQNGPLSLPDRGQGGSITDKQWEEAQAMMLTTRGGFDQLIKLIKKSLGTISYDQTDSLYGLATLGCAEIKHV